MRKPFIAGNWKMYNTMPEAVRLVNQLKAVLADVNTVEVAVCPPFTALAAVGEVLRGSNIKLGAQNLYWQNEGAYTGEISPQMLVDLGVDYCIIGHSERRGYFGETNDDVNRKVQAALAQSLGVIMCVGETLDQRRSGQTHAIVQTQIKEGLAGVSVTEPAKLVIAYEPVWAIGTGENATGTQANEVITFIRNTLTDVVGKEQALATRIQYGGSVKPTNIKEIMAQPQIDGALVGGASLNADSFAKIVGY